MKRTITSFLILFLVTCLFAQIPEWLMVESAGGIEFDDGLSICLDNDGNIYVTGIFELTASFGSYDITSYGMHDIFVAKMDSDGSWLWAKSAGGVYDDFSYELATDSDGNIYITGAFNESALFGSTTYISNGTKDIFVAKLDNTGNWLWVEQVGVTETNSGLAICSDTSDDMYVTGIYKGSAVFDIYTLTSAGDYDMFIAKIDPAGNWLWASSAGGTSDDFSYSIDTSPAGNVFITGSFQDTADFGSSSVTSNGGKDIFVAKADLSGNWLWVENFGGNLDDSGSSINVDIVDDLYVTGSFSGSADFSSTTLSSNGVYDIFVAKMDLNGNMIWAESAGGTDYDFGNSICTDTYGNVYITGGFAETVDFYVTTLTGAGGRDIFVAGINQNEGTWLWAEDAGGNHNDKGNSITTDIDGNIYITGHFVASAWFNGFNHISTGEYDVFVAKMSVSTSVESITIPTESFFSNYPNPFNPVTNIRFEISENESGILSIFNLKGQLIETQGFESGSHNYIWDASNQSSGIYFYELETESKVETRKMLLLK